MLDDDQIRVVNHDGGPVDEKKCGRCKELKRKSEFWGETKRKDGLKPWCKDCQRSYLKARRHLYADNKNKKQRERWREKRKAVLSSYSPGGVPRCACCGETAMEFLSLDHPSGGGARHRRQLGGAAGTNKNVYRWILRKDFPPGFRVLCHNCNQAIGAYGYCPHGRLQNACAI